LYIGVGVNAYIQRKCIDPDRFSTLHIIIIFRSEPSVAGDSNLVPKLKLFCIEEILPQDAYYKM
jgi:hypothetical protein